jgi:hypothetical protein
MMKVPFKGTRVVFIDLIVMVGLVWNLSLLQAPAITTKAVNRMKLSFMGTI